MTWTVISVTTHTNTATADITSSANCHIITNVLHIMINVLHIMINALGTILPITIIVLLIVLISVPHPVSKGIEEIRALAQSLHGNNVDSMRGRGGGKGRRK